jgi:hypothetical protein
LVSAGFAFFARFGFATASGAAEVGSSTLTGISAGVASSDLASVLF